MPPGQETTAPDSAPPFVLPFARNRSLPKLPLLVATFASFSKWRALVPGTPPAWGTRVLLRIKGSWLARIQSVHSHSCWKTSAEEDEPEQVAAIVGSRKNSGH